MAQLDAHWQNVTGTGPVLGSELSPWTTTDRAADDRIVALPHEAGSGICPFPVRFTVHNGDSNGHSSGYRTECNIGSLSNPTWRDGEHHFGAMGWRVPSLANFDTNGSASNNEWGIVMQYHPMTSTSPDFGIDLGKGQAKFFKRGGSSGNQAYVSYDIEAGGGLTRNAIHQDVWEIQLGSGGMLKVWHRIYPATAWDLRVNFSGTIGTIGGGSYPKIGLYMGKSLPHTNYVDNFGFRADYATFAEAEALFSESGGPPPTPAPLAASAFTLAPSALAQQITGSITEPADANRDRIVVVAFPRAIVSSDHFDTTDAVTLYDGNFGSGSGSLSPTPVAPGTWRGKLWNIGPGGETTLLSTPASVDIVGPPPPASTVTVSPGSAGPANNATQQFTATVTGGGTDKAVGWSLDALTPLTVDTSAARTFALAQLAAAYAGVSRTAYPYYTAASGAWVTTAASNWTSGFFPGSLWLAYEATADATWLTRARAQQAGVETQKNDTTSHDVGFKILSTYGQDYRITGDLTAKAVMLAAAVSLDTRWSAAVGMIRARDTSDGLFESIIDTLMNLELLYWSSANGGPGGHATHATAHALKAITNLQRGDGSTYHVAHFNESTGALVDRGTIQGFSDSSTWARGQAWAILGLSTAFGYTSNSTIRDACRSAISYWLANDPADGVSYWDFSQTDNRDTSAAAIAATGMLRMAALDATNAVAYRTAARAIIASLRGPSYMASGTALDSTLQHGVGNKPSGTAVDVGLVYGDYFYQQAMILMDAITCGNATVGSIDHLGLYTAPSAGSPTVTVKATSLADPTKFGTATVAVAGAAPISVDLVPASAAVQTAGTVQFTPTVHNGAAGVTYTVNGVAGGNATVGTITGGGLYTAPAAVPVPATVTVRATSTADGSKFAESSVTISAIAVIGLTYGERTFDGAAGAVPSAAFWRVVRTNQGAAGQALLDGNGAVLVRSVSAGTGSAARVVLESLDDLTCDYPAGATERFTLWEMAVPDNPCSLSVMLVGGKLVDDPVASADWARIVFDFRLSPPTAAVERRENSATAVTMLSEAISPVPVAGQTILAQLLLNRTTLRAAYQIGGGTLHTLVPSPATHALAAALDIASLRSTLSIFNSTTTAANVTVRRRKHARKVPYTATSPTIALTEADGSAWVSGTDLIATLAHRSISGTYPSPDDSMPTEYEAVAATDQAAGPALPVVLGPGPEGDPLPFTIEASNESADI